MKDTNKGNDLFFIQKIEFDKDTKKCLDEMVEEVLNDEFHIGCNGESPVGSVAQNTAVKQTPKAKRSLEEFYKQCGINLG